MGHYALVGRRLGHSWSQKWFEGLFARLGLEDCSYRAHETESLDGLRQWVADEEIAGFNVTIPYKRDIVPMLDATDPVAEAVGAVNCVCVSDGRLIGHNTDAPAFRETLEEALKGCGEARRALILGSGGAAHAVAYAIGQMGLEYKYVSRTPQGDRKDTIDYNKVEGEIEEGTILVNATPVGMWPDVESCPIADKGLLKRFILVYDLIYNPFPTLLLKKAKEQGTATCGGLAMLHRQAELSWQLWRQR